MIRQDSSENVVGVLLRILFLSVSITIWGQEQDKMVAYTPGYMFRDGIFLNFGMLRNNAPVSKSALLIADDFNDPDFFRRILTAGEIRFKNASGNTEVIRREDVFAFSAGGRVSIMYRERFSRDVMIGTVSLFTFSKKKYYGTFTVNEPGEGYNRGQIQPAGGKTKNYERLKYRGSNTCLLDFKTGSVLRLNRHNLAMLLSADESLSSEYMSLSGRLRKVQMFYFIGKFNEKNPLYLPEY